MFKVAIMAAVLVLWFWLYCMCNAASGDDHIHHYVKHYDHKGERYVNRCTICDKVTERQKPYKVLGGYVRINKDGSSIVNYFE